MNRALRYEPPVAERGLIVRPRLLAQLQTRFERALTAIVAAPGFGKTTLLAQAYLENRLSPQGEDHWLTCQPDDTALSFLASGTFAALELDLPVPDKPREAAILVAEAIWSAAPWHLALIFDDAHLIEPESAGGEFLTALVEELPRNGHLVLASRPPLPLHVSRLLATRDAVVLSEQEMQFRGEEVAAFAQSRGVPSELLNGVGGWPALAELTASVGPHAVTGYVWEELLSQLSDERRQALALLVAVGGADQEIAQALLAGRYANLDTLLAGLPLVVRGHSGGWRSLHPLWASELHQQLDPSQVATARRSVGAILWQRRQYHDAMDLLVRASAWDQARELIVEVCEVCTPLVPPDVLQVWQRRLPPEIRATPEGLLLAAMIAEPVNPQAAVELLEQALRTPTASMRVQYACLNALVQLAFWRSDRARMQSLLTRLSGFAARGHPEASAWVAILTALLARSPAEAQAALTVASLAASLALNPVQDWLHAHVVLLKLGDPEAAQTLALRSLAHGVSTMRAVSRSALIDSLRLRGQLGEAEARLPDLLADLNAPKVLTSPELITCGVATLCLLGRPAQAEELLAAFSPTIRSSPVAWAEVAGALAEAFFHVSSGSEQAAVAVLRGVLHRPVVLKQSSVQISPVALPLLYVLVPEARAAWDKYPPTGCFRDQLLLARALVDLRERGSLAGVRALSAAARRSMTATLPPPWSAELAAAMVAAGVGDGRATLAELGQPARSVLGEKIATSASPIAGTVRALLRELPSAPPYRLGLTTLGPVSLYRDGAPVAAPALRRERVRQLLAYLLIHDRPSRSAITAALWPDLDESAAGRNLRVTLTYLQGVLEPERRELDSPYFLRSAGGTLHLIVDESLTVDAVLFEASLEEAGRLERHGAPSAALTAYQKATDRYHGDFFADLPRTDWLQPERDRLRLRFVEAAVRAGDLLLARGGVDGARQLAERAIAADAWSETGYQLLISAQLAHGDRVSAHRTLRRCQQMLHELGVAAQQRTLALGRQLGPRD